MSPAKTPQSFVELLDQLEREASSTAASGNTQVAEIKLECVDRVRALLKAMMGWYLEPGCRPDRDHVRFILADEVVHAVKESRAESIAQKLDRLAMRHRNLGFTEAAHEIRKAIQLRAEPAEEVRSA